MTNEAPGYRPSTAHAGLGEGFYDAVAAAAFPETIPRYRNRRWAARIGLEGLSDAQWIAHFGRFEPLPDNLPEPLALRYHGHQFRVYNPDLGDGRGFLFAQAHDDLGRLLDLATKGSGTTPYSRGGDGRLTLKGGVREVLAAAMLEASGVGTSKPFSLIETGEALYRNDEPSPTRASVLVRLSHSHIRIGTFQRLMVENDAPRIMKLIGHCQRHYLTEMPETDDAARPAAFLEAVTRRVARLGAEWTAAGFVHGVLNTDNINITGESFDYGPYRFLPTYQPGFTAAYFDQSGLYSFGRQPGTLLWNLQRLAECLLLVSPIEPLEAALKLFEPCFHAEMRACLLRRLGLAPAGEERDEAVVNTLFGFLHISQAPFEQVLFDLAGGTARFPRLAASPAAAHYQGEAFERLKAALADHALSGDLALDNAVFAALSPCSLLYDEIEAIWAPIVEHDDWSLFTEKLGRIEAKRLAYGFSGVTNPPAAAQKG
jgi:uncharacterized protein YdiU (UPF0061 family)